jgi:hypothetical protein
MGQMRDRAAHLQLVHQIEAIELRGAKERCLVRTGSGVLIGSAYVRPAAPPSDDAERLQRALLPSIRRHHSKPSPRGNGWIRGALLACAMGAALGVILAYRG